MGRVEYTFVAFDPCVLATECGGVEVNKEWKLQATVAEKALSLLSLTLCASPIGGQKEEASRAHPGDFIGEASRATKKKKVAM